MAYLVGDWRGAMDSQGISSRIWSMPMDCCLSGEINCKSGEGLGVWARVKLWVNP